MPISAPKPSWPPSEKREEALTMTTALRRAVTLERIAGARAAAAVIGHDQDDGGGTAARPAHYDGPMTTHCLGCHRSGHTRLN